MPLENKKIETERAHSCIALSAGEPREAEPPTSDSPLAAAAAEAAAAHSACLQRCTVQSLADSGNSLPDTLSVVVVVVELRSSSVFCRAVCPHLSSSEALLAD